MSEQQLAEQWRQLVARSFEPRQWFEDRDDPLPHEEIDRQGLAEGRVMYIYRAMNCWYSVGYYDPKGEWHEESHYRSAEEAAHRVRWLHGGD